MKNIVSILKVIVKYGAFIAVAIKVIQYAHDEFAKLTDETPTTKNTEKDGEVVSEQS